MRPSTIAQAAPLVDSLFTTGMLAWGAPNPLMQWYVNNASARLRDNGNIEYDVGLADMQELVDEAMAGY